MTTNKKEAEGPVSSYAGLAAKRIHEEIISGDLPAGSHLYIRDMVVRMGLGATPLREGMSRLLGSGMVESVDQKGFKVSRIDRTDIEDYRSFRGFLEEEALRRSIENGGEEWQAEISDAAEEFRSFTASATERPGNAMMRYSALHKQVHSSIVSACGSPRLKTHLDLLYDQEIFFCHNLAAGGGRLADLKRIHDPDEHERLAADVLRRDAGAACGALSAHLSGLAAALTERL